MEEIRFHDVDVSGVALHAVGALPCAGPCLGRLVLDGIVVILNKVGCFAMQPSLGLA